MGELLIYLGMFVLSLAVLVFASDKFVENAERVGLSLGISNFVIGITIVAFGTSLPELAASTAAMLADESEIVINTVVGSNIANILLVLGIVAVVGKSIALNMRIMDSDVPLLLGSSFLLYFVCADGRITLLDALILLAALVIFLTNSLRASDEGETVEKVRASWQAYAMILAAGVLVYFSAEYTVKSITKISEIGGISSGVIAASLVSLGTSLPEIVVSVAAARRGNTGIALGNVIGSNAFNTFAVVSIPSFFGELLIAPEVIDFRLPFMVAMTLLLTVICISNRISRWEGAMLLLFYGYFLTQLV